MTVLVIPPPERTVSDIMDEELYHLPSTPVQGPTNRSDSPAPLLYRSTSNTTNSTQTGGALSQPTNNLSSLFSMLDSYMELYNKMNNVGSGNNTAGGIDYKMDAVPPVGEQMQVMDSINPFKDYGNPDSLSTQLQNHGFVEPKKLTNRRRRMTTINTNEEMHNNMKPLKDEEQVLFNPEISPSHFISCHDFWNDGGIYPDSLYVASTEGDMPQTCFLDYETAFIDELDEPVEEELSEDDDDNYFYDDFDQIMDDQDQPIFLSENEMSSSPVSLVNSEKISDSSITDHSVLEDFPAQGSNEATNVVNHGYLDDVDNDFISEVKRPENEELMDVCDEVAESDNEEETTPEMTPPRSLRGSSQNQLNGKMNGHLSASEMSATNPNHLCDLVNPSTGHPCNKHFSRPYDLIRHQETIHASRKKIFRCVICEGRLNGGSGNGKLKTFSRGDALSRHIKVKHGLVGSEALNIINEAKANVEYILV